MRSREGLSFSDSAGLAVDSGRGRAYVVAADAPAADVDLNTLRVSYHRLEPLFLTPEEPLWARQRSVLSLGGGRVLVFGRDYAAADGKGFASLPAGAALVDTADWSSCVLDANASGAAVTSGRLLVYGPGSPVSRDLRGAGLRAYTTDGRKIFHLLDVQQVFDVQLAAGRAYARTPRAVYVVDVSTGKVVSEIAPPPRLVDAVVEPPER